MGGIGGVGRGGVEYQAVGGGIVEDIGGYWRIIRIHFGHFVTLELGIV